ncbi:PspC domain-containing protein [Sphingomonas sp. BN140010]|uniref:PspC domain-containing protein n=1 Tax=Sphingomonas arvum TaxID=2992113 RepID=A0ABT3JC43_9SPHN|nr:PspC domain-containing protein [Sphingomonas sp. BN140010]MCW3796641.1 PspC domain-containing protein [Sphingomonas sp. BN140010]
MKSQPNLFFRPDTIFGACKGAADDLGINPLLLRIPLASLILISPELALGIYAALCVVVLAGRLLFPVRKAEIAVAAPVAVEPVEAANEEQELAAAA